MGIPVRRRCWRQARELRVDLDDAGGAPEFALLDAKANYVALLEFAKRCRESLCGGKRPTQGATEK